MHYHHHTLDDWWHVLWHDGGCVMLPLFLLSVFIAYLALDLAWRLLSSDLNHPEDPRWSGWIDAPDTATGQVGGILRFVLRRGRDAGEVRRGFEEVMSSHLPGINRRLELLGVLVTAAPLMGLLGTVLGMLDTFAALGDQSGETLERISSGISEALITTEVGLLIAVPGSLAMFVVRRKRDRFRASLLHLESLVLQRKAHPIVKAEVFS